MSDTNGTQEKQKAAKVRRKPEHESVLRPTFAAARHSTTGTLWDRDQQGSGLLQRQCACGTHTIGGGECDACRRRQGSNFLQRTIVDANSFANKQERTASVKARTFPELRIGYDFSQVRVQTDEQASSSARTLQTLVQREDRHKQQGGGGGGILSMYASGYPNPYSNDEAEIQAQEYRRAHGTYDPEDYNQAWWPHTVDFREVAGRYGSGRPTAVLTHTNMISAIQRRRNLEEARIFLHGARDELQFGRGGILNTDNAQSLPNLSHHFQSNGRLVFFACNAGSDSQLLQTIANRIGVQTCGFSTGVRWRLHWDPPTSPPPRRITRRDLDGESLPSPNVCRTPSVTGQGQSSGQP